MFRGTVVHTAKAAAAGRHLVSSNRFIHVFIKLQYSRPLSHHTVHLQSMSRVVFSIPKASLSTADETISEPPSDLLSKLSRYQTYYEMSEFDPHARNALKHHATENNDWIARAYLGILQGLGHFGSPDRESAGKIGTEVIPKLLTLLEEERRLEKDAPLTTSSKSTTVSQICYVVALYHELGWGVRRDARLAVEFYLEAAHRQHKLAQFALGDLARIGRYSPRRPEGAIAGPDNDASLTPDLETAIHWYARAAAQSHAPAQFQLGQVLQESIHSASHVGERLTQAKKYLEDAAFQGHGPAQYQLGALLAKPSLEIMQNVVENPVFNPQEAFRWFTMAADQGFPAAQTMLGVCYAEGALGVTANAKEALEWLRKAAQHGDVVAKYHAGAVLFRLHQEQMQEMEKAPQSPIIQPAAAKRLSSVKTSEALEESIRWLREAASESHVEAQVTLGQLLATAQLPVELQTAEEKERGAYHWFATVAETASPPHPEALFQLAVACQTPEISRFAHKFVESAYNNSQKTMDTAATASKASSLAQFRSDLGLKYLRHAAALGHIGAQARLGACFYHGQYGIQQDVKAALPYLEAASQQEDAASMTLLGLAHLLGQGGIPEDVETGKQWIYRAAELQYPLAMELVEEANSTRDE